MKVELKKISVMSLVASAVPVLLLVFGVLGGLFTFIIAPDQSIAERLPEIYQKNVAAGVFALGYTAATLLVLVIVALLYNVLVNLGLPGVKFFLASQEEKSGNE
ncbi:MAG: hypothetical protein HY401_03260 [Elusimicrobia bacterium]|nr:hypothetical protein [Elusimicrobiota bacterium]